MTVETRPFWRDAQYSPNHGQGYHFWHNAETYYLTGLAMAQGMLHALGLPAGPPLPEWPAGASRVPDVCEAS